MTTGILAFILFATVLVVIAFSRIGYPGVDWRLCRKRKRSK